MQSMNSMLPCVKAAVPVRAMKLSIWLNKRLPTPRASGYVEPEQAVMQQVKTWLEQAVRGCNIRLTDEPVLFKTGLSASTLPHMEMTLRPRPASEVWQEKCGNVKPT
jgi:hypothetical protein